MCISRVRAEFFRRLRLDRFVSPARFSSGEIESGHRPADAGVEREDFPATVREEHDAIGDLSSHAGKVAEALPEVLRGEVLQVFQVHFAGDFREVPGAKPESEFPELFLVPELFGAGKMETVRGWEAEVACQRLEVPRDARDVGDLGSDEGDEALPGVLPEDPDSPSGFERGAKPFVAGEGAADGGDPVAGTEETVREFERRPLDP